MLANGSVEISATDYLSETVNYTVSGATIAGKTLSASKTFPSDKSQQQYVDKAFVAETASDLSATFENILSHLNTLTTHSYDTNGFCFGCDGYQPAVDSGSDGVYEIANAGQQRSNVFA